MKMRDEHYKILLEMWLNIYEEDPEICERYETGNFVRSDRVKDLNTRFAFDMFYIFCQIDPSLHDKLNYLKDSHIHTAMRMILPILERKY